MKRTEEKQIDNKMHRRYESKGNIWRIQTDATEFHSKYIIELFANIYDILRILSFDLVYEW